jgi:hypothetical protein
MEVLSKETLALLRNIKVREALEKVLKEPSPSSTVTVQISRDDPESGSATDRESTTLTIRRLSA